MKSYGDAVVYVQKQLDGTLRRTNAIVLGSSLAVPVNGNRQKIAGAEVEEHLDIAFPVLSLAPNGQALKTRNMDEIFRPAYGVRAYTDGAGAGWEEMPQPEWMSASCGTGGLGTGEEQGSGSERYPQAEDWTKTVGAGLTDDTSPKTEEAAEPETGEAAPV